MIFFILILLIFSLAFIPSWMKSAFLRTRQSPPHVQVILFFSFELLLGVIIFISFYASYFSYIVSTCYISPWVSGIRDIYIYSDSPLTPRMLCFLVVSFLFPLFVFFKIGMVSVRDCHQTLKEQLDRVSKKKLIYPFFISFFKYCFNKKREDNK